MSALQHRIALVAAHLLGWVGVLVLTDVISFQPEIRFRELLQNPHDLHVILCWSMVVGFFYLNHYLLIPRLYLAGKRWKYAGLALLCLAGIVVLPPLLVGLLASGQDFRMVPFQGAPPPPLDAPATVHLSEPPPRDVAEFGIFILIFLISILGSLSYQIQQRLQSAEAYRLRNELSQLKAQIQPHFLFNTLNGIYALAVQHDERTAGAIVQLSEFLRYVVSQQDTETPVELRREIDYLDNYIGLQRARLGGDIKIDYRVSGNPEWLRIAPLLLFTFIENAFKHGVSPEEASPITIALDIGPAGGLHLRVVNHIVAIHFREATTGVGIENARRRLDLLYPDRHHLRIQETTKYYTIDLTLQL